MNSENMLLLSFVLFSISIAIFLIQKNLFMMLMALELGLNSANLAIARFAISSPNMDSFVWIFLFFAVAAAEAAIGLSLLIMISRRFRTLSVDDISRLKG
ncbi:MAG: NADH-quinone oxidoreductase subunit NuoK [Elusimicrobiota bacterium]